MILKSKAAQLFSLQPGEDRIVGWLLLQYFLLGGAFNFVQTAAFPLFLVEFSAQALPYVYIANAVIVTLITFLYLRLGRRLTFARLLAVNLAFLTLLILFFRLGLNLPNSSWVIFALPIMFQILVNLGNLAFWPLANRMFNVRQGKRLFGLVGSGQWLAIVLTGFMMPVLVAWLGTENLLLLGAVSAGGALLVNLYITRSFSAQLTSGEPPPPSSRRAPPRPASNLFRQRYVLLIFAIVLLWWLAFFFLDNLFYGAAAARYPDAQDMAGFLGLFLGGLGILTLFSNFFLTGPLLSRYGLRPSLLILPVLLVAGVAGMAIAASLGSPVLVLFWITTAAKLLDMGLGFSVDRSAQTVLYQPLPPMLRARAQTIAEGIVQPLANGLAGAGLLALTFLFAGSLTPLVYALLVIVILWLVTAFALGREYPGMLVQALAKRRLQGGDLSIAESACTDILQDALNDSQPASVLYAINILSIADPVLFAGKTPGLLHHKDSRVREEVLHQIASLRLTQSLPAVRDCLVGDPSPAVRSQAIRTIAVLEDRDTVNEVIPFLSDPEPQVRLGAVTVLMSTTTGPGRLAAKEKLTEMIRSPDPDERLLAAQALGEIEAGFAVQPLTQLLEDPERDVRRAALHSAGKLRAAELWPAVIYATGQPDTAAAAVTGLAAGGGEVLPAIQAAFSQPESSPAILARLAQVCGRIQGQTACTILLDQLDHPDSRVRTQVLRALSRCRYQATGFQAERIQEQIRSEAGIATEYLAVAQDLGTGVSLVLLQDALQAQVSRALDRVLYLLSFIYSSKSVLQARDNLQLASGEKRAYALEVIDVLVATEIKKILFPLLEDLVPSQRLQRLLPYYPQTPTSRQERLEQLIDQPDGWVDKWSMICAIYAAGAMSLEQLVPQVKCALASSDPLVRETAAWALAQLGSLDSPDAPNLKDDPDPRVVQAVRSWLEGPRGGKPMLSTIEKVLVLKGVRIFAETPDEILADVAQVLEEVEYNQEETIFEKGDLGDSMYIIIDGKVRVHDGENTLNHLGEREVFGEMALLDPEARVASVTAVEDTRLLRLEQEPFFELMQERIEVARGIIQVLTRYLRDRVKDLAEMRSRIEALEELAG
jgi:HEAT repeat protein